ncbi:unnamed protein product, partial [marine sediment metagenome]
MVIRIIMNAESLIGSQFPNLYFHFFLNGLNFKA